MFVYRRTQILHTLLYRETAVKFRGIQRVLVFDEDAILCYDYCLFSWLMDVRQTAAVNHGGTCSGLNWKVFIVSFYELV